MSRRLPGGFFLAVAVCLLGRTSAPAQELTVGNEDGKLVTLAGRDWQRLPHRKVQVKEKDGSEATYEGVVLAEVLRFAGVPFDGHLRGPWVANYVLVEAADKYRAVFALAEADPGMTDKVILVADRRDGKPLGDAAGPYRLVVPDDKVHSRWVRQVTRITVQTPPGPPKK
jgi:DMSO/TMAO reductase YedYZ molybdopterin-dependent catalytic subunit